MCTATANKARLPTDYLTLPQGSRYSLLTSAPTSPTHYIHQLYSFITLLLKDTQSS